MNKILLVLALISLIVLIGCEEIEQKRVSCTITDIVTVSAGGYGHADKCLFETTCGKLSLEGNIPCNKQIGDTVYK